MCRRRKKDLCPGICPNARALIQKCSQQCIRSDLTACSRPLRSQPRILTLVQRRTAGRHKRQLAFKLRPLSATAALLMQPQPLQQQWELCRLQLGAHPMRMHRRGP